MKFKVIFAYGNRSHISGNETVHSVVMTKEEFEIFSERSDVILCSVCKWEND